MRKTAAKKASPRAKAGANLIKFCQILDALPVNFSFKLDNVSNDFNGSWKKTVINGATAWQNGPRILFGSSFYPLKGKVFDAIEKEGFPLREKYFPRKLRGKTSSSLTKERVEDLYCKQKKSLQDIAKEHGCTKQWICLLMEKYGVKRRAAPEALREAVMKNKISCYKR